MNNRIDLDDLEIDGRIRIDNNDLATIKFIGEVIFNCFIKMQIPLN